MIILVDFYLLLNVWVSHTLIKHLLRKKALEDNGYSSTDKDIKNLKFNSVVN